MNTSPLGQALRYVSVGALALATSVVVPASLASAHVGARASATHGSISMRGVVLARNAARHTLVISHGVQGARTLRLSSSSAINAVALGTEIRARATKLGDGTFKVATLARDGSSRHARLRATVVSTASGRMTLSSGASVLSVNASARSAHDSASGTAQSGDVVEVSVSIGANGLDETALQNVGTTNLIELQGTLTAVSATSITLAVEEGALTTIGVPASLTLPSAIAVGNQVEVLVDYSNATFTLVTISNDDAAASSSSAGVSSSEDGQQGLVQIEGLVVAANTTSVTIQAGDQASPVLLAVPTTLDVSTLTVGARVHAEADLVGGVLTLVNFQVQTNEGDQGQSMSTEVEGIVVSVSPTSLVVQPGDQATSVTLVVPTTLDVSSIVAGDRVHASGEIIGGVLTLSDFHVQGPEDANGTMTTEVDGTVSALSATSLTIQPGDNASPLTLAVPTSLNIAAIQLGDEIHATATLVSGVLTITNFEVQSSSSDTVDLSGVLTGVSATSLTVQAGDNSQLVTLVVPSSVNVSTLAVGDHVDVVASQAGTALTVVSVTLSS